MVTKTRAARHDGGALARAIRIALLFALLFSANAARAEVRWSGFGVEAGLAVAIQDQGYDVESIGVAVALVLRAPTLEGHRLYWTTAALGGWLGRSFDSIDRDTANPPFRAVFGLFLFTEAGAHLRMGVHKLSLGLGMGFGYSGGFGGDEGSYPAPQGDKITHVYGFQLHPALRYRRRRVGLVSEVGVGVRVSITVGSEPTPTSFLFLDLTFG